VDRRRNINITDVRFYRGAQGDTDHQLVITKGAAKECVGEKKHNKNKPWFDEECLKLHEERKHARQQWLSNKSEANTKNYSNAKRNATLRFRNKKREYMTQKIQEIEKNGKTNNIRDQYRGVRED